MRLLGLAPIIAMATLATIDAHACTSTIPLRPDMADGVDLPLVPAHRNQRSAAWVIVRDTSANTGAVVRHNGIDGDPDGYAVALDPAHSFTDVRACVRVKLLHGSSGSVGLVARARDSDNCYVVAINALDSRIDVFRVVDGQMQRMTGLDADVKTEHWHTLDVEIRGDVITVSLDNQTQFAARDASFSTGQMGLWTELQNTAAFKDIEFAPLPSPG